MNEGGRSLSVDLAPSPGRRLARGVAWYLAAVAITALVTWAVCLLMWYHAFGVRGSKVEAGMINRVQTNYAQVALFYVCLVLPALAAISAFVVGARWRDRLAAVAATVGAVVVLFLGLYGLASASAPWDVPAVDHLANLPDFNAWLTAADPYDRWPSRADPAAYLLGGTILAALGASIGVWVGRGWRALRRGA